jgi:FlaA1/EpsC-like NDP-sugar epimerase
MNNKFSEFYKGSRVAVLGGAGSVGRELVAQLLKLGVSLVRALDNNESGLFDLEQQHLNNKHLQVFITDIRDQAKLEQMFDGIDYVFHGAALKHVPLCEHSPFDAVQTNIIGVQNVIEAANKRNVKKVIFTSSDKAVNPTNVMGTSKLMGERLMTAANVLNESQSLTICASTRFGNVACSSGSVIPTFVNQITSGSSITLTHKEMTRFVMTLQEAVNLVLSSLVMAKGGEVYVTKMPVLKITDLAEVIIEMVAPRFNLSPADVRITEIGPRPGEKLYEELMNDEEIRHAYELDDFYVILPAIRNVYDGIEYDSPLGKRINKSYTSATIELMSKQEIKSFLLQPGVLPELYSPSKVPVV